MNKVIRIVGAGLLLSQFLTIRPQFPDVVPNDGIGDQGTFGNPYIIQDQLGRPVGKLQPKFPDVVPHDGIGDPGSYGNPYIFHPTRP